MINKQYFNVPKTNKKSKSKSHDFSKDSSLDKLKSRRYEGESAMPYINLPNIQK